MRLASSAARDRWGDRTVQFLRSAGVAQAVERVLAVSFGNKLCWFDSSPTIDIFLYVAQAVERVLAVAFGNKLCWFESHYRHISLCCPCIERMLAVAFGTHNTNKRQTSMPPMGFEPTISAGEGPYTVRPLGLVKYRTYTWKMKINTLALKRAVLRNWPL